jgi:DNA-binding protein Fis
MVEVDRNSSRSMLKGVDKEISLDTESDAAYDRVFAELRRQSDQSILRTLEIEMIHRALKETGGNQVKASALLGITRATLRKRIEQYSIRY